MIVALHPSDELYGADRVLLSVVSRLQERDDVEVWLPTDVDYPDKALSKELAAMGIPCRAVDLPVLRRAYANPKDVAAVVGRTRHLFRMLRRARPDQIYINTSALAPAVPVAAALGIPSTLHVHETWGEVEHRALTRICTPADTVVAVGEATRLALPEVLRRRAIIRRHTVTAEPVDAEAVSAIRETADPDGSRTVILFAGRWTPNKGLSELLRALAAADDDRLHLLLLGGPPPSGTRIDAEALIEDLGLQERVSLVGEVDDVWPYLYASDVVVVPTVTTDSYPTIALEAIAAGRPLLASDVGGLPEIMAGGRGELLPAGDVTAWTRALRSLPESPHLSE